MKINFHSSVLFVKDISISKQFYQNLLGCTLAYDFGSNLSFKGGLSLWQIRDGHIIPSSLPDINQPSNRFELCFETDDMEAFVELLKSNNIALLHDLIEEPWGQLTIRFFDPDHHLVEVGEPVPVFINRMLSSGMTIEQVVQKTGVPITMVKQYAKKGNE